MKKLSSMFLVILMLLFILSMVTHALDFKGEVIYQIMVDRFYDGDTSNNNPTKSPGLYDPNKSNWKLYWGGDLEGIRQKTSYLDDLGVTALWLTPVNDNIDVAAVYNGVPNAGYHGYWARDFFAIEEHFGDWYSFDDCIDDLHTAGIKVLLDYAPNHTSPVDDTDPSFAEAGALYDNGTFVTNFFNDPNGYWHHNGGITNWDDRYETQYKNLADLADFSQENGFIHSHLQDAALNFLAHDIDGFRIDAIKHMTMGWQMSLVDSIFAEEDVYMTGEWYLGGYSDPLYQDNVKFANRTGIEPLDFYLNKAIRDVFGYNSSFTVLNNAVNKTNQDYKWKNDLAVFIDNHDMPRFLTINNDYTRLHQALSFILTCRGIPIIYYGTEQYLHDDTNGGGDPYNRPMMNSWNQNTTAFQLISQLSTLRQSQPAIKYGDIYQRWLNDDVYIYERKFYDNVVLVAINKSSSSYITGLYTELPAGSYGDYLTGLLSGTSLYVNSNGYANNFTLPANSVSVWTYQDQNPNDPHIGSIGPVVGRTGNTITIGGEGFGTGGQVYFAGTSANVISWSGTEIQVTVPTVTPGVVPVKVYSGGTYSNEIDYEVLSGALVPVFFTVKNAYTNWGDNIFLTGSVPELGNWSTDFESTYGPLLCPNYPDWFTVAAVPAGTTIQFKYIKIDSNGNVTWEGGSNHQYTVPSSGVGNVTVYWQ